MKKQNTVKKSNHGGKRPGSGRKKKERTMDEILSKEMEAHMWEKIEVVERNRTTGQVRTVKKHRWITILDTLSHKAIVQKDVSAAKEYFDRVWGKPPQALRHFGNIDVQEQKLPTKAELAAADAYNKVLLHE